MRNKLKNNNKILDVLKIFTKLFLSKKICLCKNKLINLIEIVEKENLAMSVLKNGKRKIPKRLEQLNFLCLMMNNISELVGLLLMLLYKK